MIAILKKGTTENEIKELTSWFEEQGVRCHLSKGDYQTIIGLIGDTSHIDTELVESLDMIESVRRISEPFKKANRKFHPDNTVIKVGNVTIGDGSFNVMAGPCSIESETQIIEIAKAVKAAGATILRGGAFKPRTSPYAFQGLHEEGIKYLIEAKEETGLPVITEIMDARHLPLFEDVDILQVGARNMQNFELLKALGETDKPVLLKRGLSSTLTELLMSAEYIMASGNPNVILCERGIRTFETATRNTLDVSAVPVLRELSHLPIIVDPSHATGVARYVKPMAMCGTAAGADGLEIEVHTNPKAALSDGAQSLTPAEFEDLMQAVAKIHAAL